MKSLSLYVSLVAFTFVINFGIYLFSYNKIIFPHLTESQRMDIAPIIFSNVLLGYFVASIFIVVLIVVAKTHITKSSNGR